MVLTLGATLLSGSAMADSKERSILIWTGIRLGTTTADMYRAIHEGVMMAQAAGDCARTRCGAPLKSVMAQHLIVGATTAIFAGSVYIKNYPDRSEAVNQVMADAGLGNTTASTSAQRQRPISPIANWNRRVAPNMPPPGRCADDELSSLERKKDDLCNRRGTQSCDGNETGEAELRRKISLIDACVRARINIMDRCFNGGNASHHGEVDSRMRGWQRCVDLLMR
jgi:hypothetical protein